MLVRDLKKHTYTHTHMLTPTYPCLLKDAGDGTVHYMVPCL